MCNFMKQLSFILTIIFLNINSFGQTYVGHSTDKIKSYSCALKINVDSSTVFIYNNKSNEIYAQYIGTINKINDSTFHINAKMNIGKFDVMRLNTIDLKTNKTNDTDYCFVDSNLILSRPEIGLQ